MAMMGGKGMGMGKPPMGGPAGMPEDDLFGGMGAAPSGDVSDEDIDSMFGEEDMASTPDDKLYQGLSMAGYAPTPEQMQQIKAILEGGMAPEGVEATDTGMEATPSM